MDIETIPKQEPRAQLATVQETAETLGVTPKCVYELINRGDIPAVKVGRVWRVNLEAFVNRGGTQW